MKRTLRNIVGGLGLLAMVSGCITPAGAVLMGSRDPGARVVGTFMYHEGAHQDRMEEAREGRSQVNVYNNQRGISDEDRRILNQIKNMPRVICIGDVDNDGWMDWVYYDGKGNEYGSRRWFKKNLDEKGYSLQKDAQWNIETFTYTDYEGNWKEVPRNALIIWHYQ